jgi:glutaredoxin
MKLILATSKFCGPCALLKRKLQSDKLEVETIDMEEDTDKFRQYGVRSVPRLLVVEDDEVTEVIQGNDEIIKKIKEHDQNQKVS